VGLKEWFYPKLPQKKEKGLIWKATPNKGVINCPTCKIGFLLGEREEIFLK